MALRGGFKDSGSFSGWISSAFRWIDRPNVRRSRPLSASRGVIARELSNEGPRHTAESPKVQGDERLCQQQTKQADSEAAPLQDIAAGRQCPRFIYTVVKGQAPLSGGGARAPASLRRTCGRAP